MFATAVTDFADRLVDELAPVTVTVTDVDAAHGCAGSDVRLAVRLDQLSRSGVDDAELYAAIVEVDRLRNLVEAAQTRLLSTAGRIDLIGRLRLRSPAGLLTGIGVPPATAHRIARNARRVDRLSAVARGMRGGTLAGEKADAVCTGVEFVEKRRALDEQERTALVGKLLVQEVPGDVARRAREYAIATAPRAHDEDSDAVPAAENAELNEMTVASDEEGRVVAQLDLDVWTGEELTQALDPLTRPITEPDGSPDPRSAGQRRADALGQVIRAYLSGSDRPTSGGVLPHATLIVPTSSVSSRGVTPDAMSPVATTMFTGPVSPATVELALCTAAVAAVTVDADGAPLDVGREERLFTPAIRRALLVRDRGCARPGCGRPASWCDAHHVRPWSQGGDTSVDNGVLLCRRCHTLVHHGGWAVFIGHDRQPWFVPPVDPARQDRRREPIRSHARRTLTVHAAADAA